MSRLSSSLRITALVGSAFVLAIGSASAAPPSPDPSGLTATQVTDMVSQIDVPKSSSGKIAESDPALLARTDTKPVQVMVKLDLDGTATYAGGVDGLAPTSPSTTGKSLQRNAKAVSAYEKHADSVIQEAEAAIRRAVPKADVGRGFTTAYGGVSVTVPADQAKDLLKADGVVAVQPDTIEQLQTDATPAFVGATALWPSLGGSATAGEGVIVGVLDSGVWPEHPSFVDPGIAPPTGAPFACEFGGSAARGPDFACNDKLVGAYAFLDTYLAVVGAAQGEYCDASGCSARDSEGHGTHTATTAAGSPVEHAPIFGVDRGPVSGIAPGSSVIAYRVCLEEGCFGSDSVQAVEQAIIDGVDVINFSISGGNNPYTDPVELAFLDATAAGISVNASAGNAGPAAGTAAHGGPWVTTVAASTSDRHFQSTMTLTAGNGETFSKVGSTLTQGVTDVPVVRAPDVAGYSGGSTCLSPFAPGSLAGQVVVCERGVNGRIEKGYNASLGGASGMILYNPTASDTETDNHFLPAVHLEGPNTELLAFLAGHTGVTATWAQGDPAEVRGDVMAGFSSRGPLGDFLKPDITAPGVQILAGLTPTPVGINSGPSGELFQAIAGTSMSSPHLAGASALLKAAHPAWTPGQIKSALMTSSAQDVLKEDGVTPADPFDRGAGSMRVDRASAATVTISETPAALGAPAGTPSNRIDLNLPSIQASPLPGSVTTQRTLQNVTTKWQAFTATAVGTNGLAIGVTPKKFSIAPGGSKAITVTLDGTSAPQGWSFGSVTLTPKKATGSKVVLPVAANVSDSALPMTHTCDPTEVAKKEATHCTVTLTNTGAVPADAQINLKAPKHMQVSSVSAPATGGYGFSWAGTLAPAAPPSVTSITAGGSPAGYLPLSLFDISPIGGVSDESITNFNVPAFQYGSETYTRIGIVSNGYLVLGGGTGADVTFQPQPIPSNTRPNNIVAPFWTDLNPGAGGAVRIGTLTDGVSTWIVVDYAEIPTYGTSETSSFEVWLQIGDTESVTIAHALMGDPSSDGLSQGAENRDGTSGATYVGVSNTDWTVNTAPSQPGGTVSITYDASSRKSGTYVLAPQATSPVVKGTISVAQTIRVR